MIRRWVAAGMLWCLAGEASAGVWVRPQGEGYAQLSAAYTAASRAFDEGGEAASMSDPRFTGPVVGPIFDGASYAGSSVAVYGELGVAPGSWPLQIELVGQLPVRWSTMRWGLVGDVVDDVVQRNLGLGDATVGARAGRSVGAVAVAATLMASLPLYDNSPRALRQAPGNSDVADDRVALGQGTVELVPGVGVGVPLAEHGWVQATGGLRLRDRRYAPGIPSSVQVGLRPVAAVAVLVEAEGLATLPGGQQPRSYLDAWGKSVDVIDGVAYLKGSTGVLLSPPSTSWGGLVRVGRTLWARRSLQDTTVSVGLFREFS